MASLFEEIQKKADARRQYLADNPNPNRLQKPIDYSPEAERQKVANVAGTTGGLYSGSVGLGGDVEGVVKAQNNSAGILDVVRLYVSKALPLPKEVKQQIAPNLNKPEFLEELNRIFEESDTFLTNSLDAREDVINFFSDDGLGNSLLKNTPIGNNGIGDLLKEADDGAWLTGEIFAPIPIPKFSKFVKNQAEDFINTGNNIGDKVVDNVVQTTKNVRDAGKSIYQTLEEGMSPEMITPDGQTVKATDFENQPLKSAEYFDENGINEVTGNRAVDSQHLEDYNRGLEEAIETEKITTGDELSDAQVEKVKNQFVEDFYGKNPKYVEEGIIRVDQDGRTVLRKADNLQAKELKDKPLFSGAGTKGSTDTEELFGADGTGRTPVLNDTDISMRTFSVDEVIEGSSLERLVGKDITDLTEVRIAYPQILAKEAKTGQKMTTSEIVDEINGIVRTNGNRIQTPDASFSSGISFGGIKAGKAIDDANFYKSTLGWIEETGGVASNDRVMQQINKMIESGIFRKPKSPSQLAKLSKFDAPFTVVDTKGKFDRLPPLLKQKMYNEAERLATIEEINQWAIKNRKQLVKYDATNIEPLMVSRALKYDGQLLKNWVVDIERKAGSGKKPYETQIRELALGINPNTGKKFSSFKVDEQTFIHELENHLNQRVQQGNRGGGSQRLMNVAKIDDTEQQFFNPSAVQKYDYNQYQGLKGESEARFGERNWKTTNEELVETNRSGFDRFPKEHRNNYMFEKKGGKKYSYFDEDSLKDWHRPIENSISRVVAGTTVDERNILKLVKAMLKDPAGFENTINNMLLRAKGQNPASLEFDAPMPIKHIEAKIGEHLEHTPKNPSPEVGDRFELEYAGGLEAKKLADIEAMKNGSILPMIWDSSSANYYIRSVSGHTFKYPRAFMTHGGDDFSRVIKNQERGIGGASNYEVVKTIRDRVEQVRKLNLEKGGSGDVFLMTRRMSPYRTGGSHPMDFSVQPTQLTLAILDNQPLSKVDIARIDKSIREMPITKKVKENGKEVSVKTFPFKNFKGIMTAKGRDQLFGLGKVGTSAGNLRKAFMNRMATKQNQKAFHFNIEDVDMALTDPALRGVPYGYMGNAIIKAPDDGIKILKGDNISYPYDFGGKYFGTMNHNFHMRTLYGKQYDEVLAELTKKNKEREKPKTMEAVHAQVVDALSKRKNLDQSSVYVDNDVYETLKGLQRPLEKSMGMDVGLLQTETSAKTSINKSKMATPFKKIDWKEGEVNLDYGGGKFDNADEYLQTKGARNLVFDPFNRSAKHNAKVTKAVNKKPADTGTMTNVLNVIDSEKSQIEALTNLSEGVKDGGKVYISVYEGNRTGLGKKTSSGYQQNKKTKDYLKTVQKVFPNAKIEKGMIVATN